MPVADASATKPWLIEPPAAPRPDTTNTRSPTCTGSSPEAQGSAGRSGRSTTRRARSLAGSQAVRLAGSSSSPLRGVMPGVGSCVLARTVANEASRTDGPVSGNTTNAEPTEGWPAPATFDHNQTQDA